MSQPIKTIDAMREELKKLPSRMGGRVTLTGITNEARCGTVAEFATRPHVRKGVNMSSLFQVFAVAGHELVASRPDLGEVAFRSDGELKDFISHLSKESGKSITAMCTQAGISLGILSWVTGSSGTKTVQLEPLLKLFNSEKVVLKLRKNQPTKAAAKKALFGVA